MSLFLDVLILFRSATCFMTVIECSSGHSTVWSSEQQQCMLDGCKYVEKRQSMQKIPCLGNIAVITKEDFCLLLFPKS